MIVECVVVLWIIMVSCEYDYFDFFDKIDWCGKDDSFFEIVNWENVWEVGDE